MLYSLNISTAWNRYKAMLLQEIEKCLQHSKYSYHNITTRNHVPSLHNSMPIPHPAYDLHPSSFSSKVDDLRNYSLDNIDKITNEPHDSGLDKTS